ncbi:MAG: hypothetical protein JXQ73_28885 [Phycisphaerae bacterium]|nr:hypothetical protein [Phycisphaerae bacterium]
MAGPGVIERFARNREGFFRQHRLVVAVFVVALMCDALSTTYFMLTLDSSEELHPVVSWVAAIFGPIVGPLIGFAGKASAGLCVAIYLRRWAAYILIPASVISLWAAWYNVWGVHLYVPNLLRLIPW